MRSLLLLLLVAFLITVTSTYLRNQSETRTPHARCTHGAISATAVQLKPTFRVIQPAVARCAP